MHCEYLKKEKKKVNLVISLISLQKFINKFCYYSDMSDMAQIRAMSGYAVGIGVLAIVTVTVITVLGGFKDTGLVDNTLVDKFINGLAIFGTFVGVIVLAIVGKIIIGLFKGQDM